MKKKKDDSKVSINGDLCFVRADQSNEEIFIMTCCFFLNCVLEFDGVSLVISLLDFLQVHLGMTGYDPGKCIFVCTCFLHGNANHLLEVPLRTGDATDYGPQHKQEIILWILLQILFQEKVSCISSLLCILLTCFFLIKFFF